MKLIKSFAFAITGIKTCFAIEINFKIHLCCAMIVTTIGLVCNISATEWMIVISCIAFVTAMEMMNTAIEKLCDMVSKDFHPTIKIIKDVASGAVLLAAIGSLIIGAIIFIPKVFVLIKSL